MVTLPVNISGNHYIIVHTDYQNLIFENNIESNNLGNSSTIQITLTNWPDLTGGGGFILDDTFSTLDYTCITPVLNAGTQYANGNWTDALYISKSPVWNPSASTLIGTYNSNGNITSSSTYNLSPTISLPLTSQIVNGTDSSFYYLYYVADFNNNIFENTGENNNVFRSDSLYICNFFAESYCK